MSQRLPPGRELRGVLLAVLLGFALTYYVGLVWSVSGRARSVDFVQFFVSARAVVEGRNLYQPLTMRDIGMAPPPGRGPDEPLHPNLNPPFLAVVLAPASSLGLEASYAAWAALSLFCALASCWGMVRTRSARAGGEVGLLWFWLAILAYYPTYTAVMLGQVTFVLMLVLVGAWHAARSGRHRTAGLLLGLAVNLKLFVALLPVYLVWQRRWKAVGWTALSAAGIALATLPFVGFAAYREYVRLLPTVDWYSSNWNASYASVFTRVLGGSENRPFVDAPALANAAVALCSAGTLAGLAWLTRPVRESRQLVCFDLGFGLTMIAMLLLSPLGWMYYFPSLALPGYLGWRASEQQGSSTARWGLLACWGLSTIPLAMVRAADVNNRATWLTLDSLYFYALMLMMVVAARELLAARTAVRTRLDGGS